MMKYWFGAEEVPVSTEMKRYWLDLDGNPLFPDGSMTLIHVFVTKGALKRWMKESPKRTPAIGNVIDYMISIMCEAIIFQPDSDTDVIGRYVAFCDKWGLYKGYSPIVGEVVPSWYDGCHVLMEEA